MFLAGLIWTLVVCAAQGRCPKVPRRQRLGPRSLPPMPPRSCSCLPMRTARADGPAITGRRTIECPDTFLKLPATHSVGG
jgi:hypothetical protein